MNPQDVTPMCPSSTCTFAYSIFYLCNCQYHNQMSHRILVLQRLNAHEGYHGVHGRTRPTGKQLAKGSLSKFDVWITLTIHVGYILKLYNQMSVSIPNIYIYVCIHTDSPDFLVCWEHFDFILYVFIWLMLAREGRKELPGHLMIWSLPMMHQT